MYMGNCTHDKHKVNSSGSHYLFNMSFQASNPNGQQKFQKSPQFLIGLANKPPTMDDCGPFLKIK